MRQILAILADSFREAADRRALAIMLILSVLPIVFCFGMSFDSEPLDVILDRQARDLVSFHRTGQHVTMQHPDTGLVVGPVAPVTPGGTWPDSVAGGLSVELTWPGAKVLDDLAIAWYRFQRDDEAEVERRIDGVPRTLRFLEERFRAFGYDEVAVDQDPRHDARVTVAVRSHQPATIQGAHAVWFLFGALRLPLDEISVAEFVLLVQAGLASVFVGFIGMLVALSACSAFVPNMLQKGTLDLVLARPISRTRLLLAKYLGGLWFVFVLATFLIGGCWLGLLTGSGYTNPWFLASIPTLTASFGVLYSVAVLFGVLTRSGTLSALAAVGVWGISSSIIGARTALTQFRSMGGDAEAPAWLQTALDAVYVILPKVKDIDHLNTLLLAQHDLSDAARQRIFGHDLPEVDWALSLSTTAGFTCATLALAVWMFRRRDF